MRRHPRHRALAVLAIAWPVLCPVALTACGGDPATKDEFVDHALEISEVNDEGDSALLRNAFECVYPEVAKDEATLEEFMDSDEVTGDSALGAKMSKLITPCITSAATSATTTAPPTTAG